MLLSLFILISISCCVQALVGTTTEVKCSTKVGKLSLSIIPTTTRTTTHTLRPVTVQRTLTPTVTVTPLPITTTLSTTVTSTTTTTELTITDTFSTTLTDTLSLTTTETDVSTTTETTTTSTSTTVTSAIPTSSGFLPVDDTTATVYPAKRRAIRNPHGSKKEVVEEKRSTQNGCFGSHPKAVSCIAEVEIQTTVTRTHTAHSTTTVLPPSVISTTLTVTSTTTSTIVPYASTTTTFSTTITTTSTSTTIQTTTTTSTETNTATTTVTTYEACATSNLLGPLPNGDDIVNVYNEGLGNPDTFIYQPAAFAYDCCVACITSSVCTGTAYISGPGICILLQNSADTCGPQSSSSGFYVSQPSTPSSSSLIVSNGNCGYLYDGGIGM